MPTVSLRLSTLFRNKMDAVVQIVSNVSVDDKMYKKGFRFRDHRGSYYTEDGSVKSRLFGKLDLVEEISFDEESQYLPLIHRQAVERLRGVIRTVVVTDKCYRVCKKILPITSGANVGIGLSILRIAPGSALAHLAIGVAGIICNERTPARLYDVG